MTTSIGLLRIDEGWTYGPIRENGRKQPPLLVPWESLSEPEAGERSGYGEEHDETSVSC